MAHKTYIRATKGTVTLNGSAIIGVKEIARKMSANKRTRTHIVKLSKSSAIEVAALKAPAGTVHDPDPPIYWGPEKVVFRASRDSDGNWHEVRFGEKPKKKGSPTSLKRGQCSLSKAKTGFLFVRGSLRISAVGVG